MGVEAKVGVEGEASLSRRDRKVGGQRVDIKDLEVWLTKTRPRVSRLLVWKEEPGGRGVRKGTGGV